MTRYQVPREETINLTNIMNTEQVYCNCTLFWTNLSVDGNRQGPLMTLNIVSRCFLGRVWKDEVMIQLPGEKIFINNEENVYLSRFVMICIIQNVRLPDHTKRLENKVF